MQISPGPKVHTPIQGESMTAAALIDVKVAFPEPTLKSLSKRSKGPPIGSPLQDLLLLDNFNQFQIKRKCFIRAYRWIAASAKAQFWWHEYLPGGTGLHQWQHFLPTA